MTSLSQQQWLRLHEAILYLQAQENLTSISGAIVKILHNLIDCETCGVCDPRVGLDKIPWIEVSHSEPVIQTRAATADHGALVWTPYETDFAAVRDVFLDLLEEQPMRSDYRSSYDGRVRTISDMTSLQSFRNSALFSEIYYPIDREMTIFHRLPSGDSLVVTAGRAGPDFNDRERLILELLRPHIAMVYNRALERELVQKRSFGAEGGAPLDLKALARLGLTPRQSEVLYWVAEGKTSPEIGLILGMSTWTVRDHLKQIFVRLGVETRTAAARLAIDALASAT